MNEPRVLGRYAVFEAIGGGGMATVHLGRLIGQAGFSRVVAIKRIHPHNANDPEYATMLLDEARLAARVRHPNVVPVLDVVVIGRELLLVMEYVHGAPLSALARAARGTNDRVPFPIASRIVLDALAGLHAAHEAKTERGRPLGLVHRDVSPQNILVGEDGVARITDFGVAKAEGKLGMTRAGEVKGKLAYMAPEQLRQDPVDRRTDVFAAGIVLWELLAGQKLIDVEGRELKDVMQAILDHRAPPPSTIAEVPPALDAVVMKALANDPAERWPSADAMANALEEACPPARAKDVASWVVATAGGFLAARAEKVGQVEQASAIHVVDPGDSTPPPSATQTMTSHPPPPALITPPARSWSKIGVGALAAVLIFVGSIVIARRREEPPAPLIEDREPSASVANSVAEVPIETAPTSPTVIDTIEDAGPRKKHPKKRAVGPDCDPPYSIDSRGIRIPRPECFARSP